MIETNEATTDAQETIPTAAPISPAQQRANEASAKYQDGPGPVDITFGKIGDRFGFFVTMAEIANLKITVSCPLIPHDVTFASDGFGFRWTVHADRMMLPQEAGVSVDGCYGKTITRSNG